jgi:hypothetical protein
MDYLHRFLGAGSCIDSLGPNLVEQIGFEAYKKLAEALACLSYGITALRSGCVKTQRPETAASKYRNLRVGELRGTNN